MTSIVGYTRQLASAPSIELDTAELTSAGAQSIFTDGRVADVRQRPGLAECLRSLEPGDLLITSSAVRLSHSLPHFVTTIADLSARGILFQSLTEPALSTTVSTDASTTTVLRALEDLRRELMSVQTREGLRVAGEAGRRPGRPTVMTEERLAVARELRLQGRSFAHVGLVLGVSANAVQRALQTRAVVVDGSSV